jgi:adenylate cyclase
VNSVALRLIRFFTELKRRRVFRVAAVYGVSGWLLVQVAATTFPALKLPDWTVTLVVVLVVLGFPVAVALAWAFDLTPAGLERTAPLEAPAAGADAVPPGAAMGPATGAVAARSAIPPTARSARPPAGVIPFRRVDRDARGAGVAPASEGSPPPDDPPPVPPDPERVRRASLAHVRHELRSPITAILGYSEMLLDDLDAEDAGARADLETMVDAGRQLVERVDAALHPEILAQTDTQPDWEAFGARLRDDLGAPVQTVIERAGRLLDGGGGAEAVAADLRRILEAARQLSSRIDDVVRLAAAGAAGTGGDLLRPWEIGRSVLAKIRPLQRQPDADPAAATLLVVDDNPTNRDLLSRQLARQGYAVFTAANGREALERLQERRFDLVLLDLVMPEMDGIETLERIRASEALGALPVIMVSALDEIDSVVRCIELGAADYLTKPFDPVLLRARIGASLDAHEVRRREARLLERLDQEQAFADLLLHSLLPEPIAAQLRAGILPGVEVYDQLTALSAELPGYARAADDGREAAERLGALADEWDGILRGHGLYPLRFAGGVCTAVAGLTPSDDDAAAAAAAALQMQHAARAAVPEGEPNRLRIGLHSGAACAGVVGSTQLRFEAWGEAIDIAERLRLGCDPGAIHVSPAIRARLRDRYAFASRGVLDVPGGGQMRGYHLQDESVAARAAPR